MSLQLRFVLLITSIMTVLVAGLWLQQVWDDRETGMLRQGMTRERAEMVDKLLDVTGQPLQVLVSDYSLWDDMVNFVSHPDPEWARINIAETGMTTHHADAAWVFRPDLVEVYGAVAKEHETLRPFPLPRSALVRIATGMAEPHFFASTPAGLLEIRGAPIRPTDVHAVVAAPYGWLFVGRLWDDAYLQKLALLTDSAVSLAPTGAPANDESNKLAVTITKPLTDWQGRPVLNLRVLHTPLALSRMQADNRMDLAISTAFGLVALVAFVFATRFWVIRPLAVLESSLEQNSPAPLPRLHSSSKEFNRLGRLVEKSFQHEMILQQVFDAFNAIQDAVLIIETDTRRITHVNDGALKLLGYRRDELTGRSLADLETEPAVSTPPFAQQAQLRQQTRWYRCRDGRLLEVEIREQTLPASAVAPLRVIVARDVTEMKQQEQQRLQAQRLESLGNLAGGVAHDMNNMLTPITMFLEELQQTDSRPSPELLASVRSSVKRGAGMLRQLLTFGRGIAGERQPLAVPRLLDEIGRIVASTFPKSIQFEARPARNVRSIIGDPTQLHQVLLNLCVNARDAMPQGGRLTLSAENLQVDHFNQSVWDAAAPGNYVLIEVADTGTGIPPELLGRIFDPFFTTKSADQGTGLGLSTSLGIIRSHGGSIRVESEPGHGARFRILLPADDKSAATDSADKPAEFAGRGRTVLVVEDEANIRVVLDKTLRRLALCVVLAENGESALALFQRHRADISLVISDLHMPGMDGLALVRAIRDTAPDLPILVMSGRVDDHTREAINALRISGIVDKPFGFAQIVQALRQALG
jgi:PAS domain S-box-containing protein